MSPSSKKPLTLVLAACLVALIVTCCKQQENLPLKTQPPVQEQEWPVEVVVEEAAQGRSLLTFTEEEEAAIMEDIREKLKPKDLLVDENRQVVPHQFMHLHHMKTGGTSVDHLLRCARDRMEKEQEYSFHHYSIHECARKKFAHCMDDDDDPCRASMQDAGTMSFCSALKHLPKLGWDQVPKFTVLRHPVERVWSMYRFETRLCYKCQTLLQIYDRIDTGDTDLLDSLCLAQLQNHETANLLTSDWPEDATDEDIVAEAIHNLKSSFTVIGLTEELFLTSQILGSVFPWVNKTIEGSRQRCSLPHDNSSPTNNHCIKHNRTDGKPGITSTHWELPDHPDEETREAIERHNQLDIKLYEAAVQYFKLQEQVYKSGLEES